VWHPPSRGRLQTGNVVMSGGGLTPDRGWVATPEGDHLRGRRVRDTRPEVALRKAVHRLGLRFRLHQRVAPRCTADFVLPRYHVAVFVDGCFWYGCPKHGPKMFRGPNAERGRTRSRPTGPETDATPKRPRPPDGPCSGSGSARSRPVQRRQHSWLPSGVRLLLA
jgi:hypothetical protein